MERGSSHSCVTFDAEACVRHVSDSSQTQGAAARSSERDLFDVVARDAPGPQLGRFEPVDHERAARPEACKLAIGARRDRGRLRMRMEDGQLVALVLEK